MYVRIDDFDDEFNLNELINNELLQMVISYEDFYYVTYNEKLYNRLVKISKLSYTDDLKKLVYSDKIDKYIKIIKYCLKQKYPIEDILTHTLSIEMSKSIDKHIMDNIMSMSSKKMINDEN